VIRGLLDKVEVGAPPTENLERYKQGCSVTIRTRDGRTSSSTVYAPRGAAVLGIRWEDVEEKYRALAPFARLSPQAIEASCKTIRELRDLKNIGALITLLR
jgi:2-methylcitrate dehydratase PrpD